MTLRYRGHPLVGFGEGAATLPIEATSSPWTIALATTVVSTATGWAIEELARKVRRKKR